MRLESALEIVGALKRRFGEPMTVIDIRRATPLSYQPVYEYVRRLAAQGALTLRKAGQRLLCEPAASPAGALWLAHWSLRELQETESGALREVATRLGAGAPGDVVVAEVVGRGVKLYVTDPAGVPPLRDVRVEVVPLGGLAELVRGPDADWVLARRALPLRGHQLFWSLALEARQTPAESLPPAPAPGARRRSVFD